ncbi:hypothetical protein IQ241_03040 [Romeria aff. gracilis LEGE 07310]|uniref:Uncharacterized protein n=1 Tax=Vasconcelosia minhoensis LEGE 07310 TaxID=915328 RepID=A0A8J7DMB4_9CYAN|nr:hypothetical protein [Romeria gracilis]MBE9076280.1 hypothetical protein [Romeria aff. gracilis LEGE 07310]
MVFSEVLRLWQSDDTFRSFFFEILTDSPFVAYMWETPSVSCSSVQRPFEFVLVDAPELDRAAEPDDFQDYFSPEGQGIVSFENLGGDALMIVPSPRTAESAYVHLAKFVREGPTEQVQALWQAVGREMRLRISDRALWLSTSGADVAWLHVRVDSRPKYYAYKPYKQSAQAEHHDNPSRQ